MNIPLESIGFYTLSDYRAKNTSITSSLKRCELILTDSCNFKCPYCRGIRDDFSGELSYEDAQSIVGKWLSHNLENIRFSGGEPTLYPGLLNLVKYTKSGNVGHIAISSNGSADYTFYEKLISAGVNDFSISLDACCASMGDAMAGGMFGAWKHLTDNIRRLSKRTYVTVGVVVTKQNLADVHKIVEFASNNLGVQDIRIISAAQRGCKNEGLVDIPQEILDKHPILKYRFNNVCSGSGVRGINDTDNQKCHLMMDDMACLDNHHFPCIIYMREGGDPVGSVVGKSMEDIRKERLEWINTHNTHCDKICKNNCLDVCVDYNNRVESYL
jgi:molybdenum cofactor biosynthesis enzyme MoaA